MKDKKLIILIAPVLVVFIIAGCEFLKFFNSRDGSIPFSHKKHVQDLGLECSECHQIKEEEIPTMPGKEKCHQCHGIEDKDIKEAQETISNVGILPQKCHQCHGTTLKPIVWKGYCLLDDLKFSHKLHSKINCNNCHKDINQSEYVSPENAPYMNDCVDCHRKNNMLTRDCNVCHMRISVETSPASHLKDWTRNHGKVVRTGYKDLTANRCDLCHKQSECMKCHMEKKPTWHTQAWRYRGHAASAKIDRSRCQLCHQTDSCDRCHRETSPLSHRTGWNTSPSYNHCRTCHVPLSSQGCYTCHKSTTGHLNAPVLPSNITHQAASSPAGCLSCHSANLKHPNNGDNCKYCHK